MTAFPVKLACALFATAICWPSFEDSIDTEKNTEAKTARRAASMQFVQATQQLPQPPVQPVAEPSGETLKRLDLLRLQYLAAELTQALEDVSVFAKAMEYEGENMCREEVLRGLWIRFAEAQLSVQSFERSLREMGALTSFDDRYDTVEPMPFGAGPFGPWSTGLPPARP